MEKKKYFLKFSLLLIMSFAVATFTSCDERFSDDDDDDEIPVIPDPGSRDLFFDWNGERVMLEQTTEWVIVQNFPAANSIGFVNMGQRRSFRVSGINNFNVGVKSNVRLHIVENGEAERTIEFERFEVEENREGVFTAVGHSAYGMLVIQYRVN